MAFECRLPSHQNHPGRKRRDTLRLMLAGLLLTLSVLAVQVLRPDLFAHIDNKTFDVLISRTERHRPSSVPVIIGIDDRALARYGQWPWPRHHLARLISRLNDAGVDLVILDLILFGKDRTSPLTMQEELHQDFGLHLSIENLPADKRDNDRILARTLAAYPVVLGYKLDFTASPDTGAACTSRIDPVLPAAPMAAQAGFTLHQATSMVCSLPELNNNAQGLGFINALADSDGVLRRVPLIADYQNGIYPGLILAALIARADGAGLGLGRDMDGGFIYLNQQRIHLDPHGHLLLRYRGPRKTFPTFSAAAILADPLPDLSRSVAIVGPTAPGLGDLHVSPLDRAFPGVEVHATILDNILQDDFLIRPAWAKGAESLGVLVAGLLSTLMIVVAGPVLYMLAITTAALGAWSLSAWMLAGPGCWISPLGGQTVLILNTTVLSLMEYGLKARELHLSTQELVKSQDATILGLTALAETRDTETGGHINRTRKYVRILARSLALKPAYRRQLDPDAIEMLYKTAPLHDIGKVGIADQILLKPGSLTAHEYREMQRHTLLGAEALAKAEHQAFGHKGDRSFLSLAREIALSHHEKWDGSGYPQGLRGTQIPLGGRLMALADVYDALISRRVYKAPMAHEQAVEIIRQGRGTHFDPDLVDAFIENQDQFRAVSTRYT